MLPVASLVLSLSLSLPVAPVTPAPTVPSVVVSAGLSADVASTSCGRDDAREPRLFRIARDVQGWPDDTLLDSGNVLGASALGDLAVRHDADGFAQALRSLGIKGLALGRRDLATSRPVLLQAARALQKTGTPFVVSNLSCTREALEVCDAVAGEDGPAFVVDTPQGKLGMVAALSPQVFASVAKDRARGLRLSDPAQALVAAAAKARAQGAKWVIAFFDGDHGHELEEMLGLASKLGAQPQPVDALVASHVDQLASATASGPHALPIFTTHAGRALQIFPFLQQPLATGPDPKPELVTYSRALQSFLCQRYVGAEHGWTLTHSLDRDGVAALVLDALRESTHAEIALFNTSAIQPTGPLAQNLTRLDIATALPFDNNAVTARIPGSLLKKALTVPGIERTLYARGVTKAKDGSLLVNGRALDETQPYLVVTNDYLAAGGDGVLPEKGLSFTPVSASTVRELWIAQLERRRARGIPADAPIPDLSRRTRWTFRASVDLSFTQVRVSNPATDVFTDTQLARADSVAFTGDIEARADADHPEYTFENGLSLQEGLAQTATTSGTNTGLTETQDLITLRDTAALRRYGNSTPRWYIPVPFAESYLESEFKTPTTRSYHHLEWRPIAGFRLPILPELSLYAGTGLDWETLATRAQMPLDEPTAAWAVMGGAQLRPKRLLKPGLPDLEGEGSLDVTWRDPTDSSSALVRLHAKISVPIFKTLSLTASYDLFARHLGEKLLPAELARSHGWGFSGDTLVGLSYKWVEPVQAYAF